MEHGPVSGRDHDLDSVAPEERPYDPELPFLVDLEREVHREAQRVADARSRLAREHQGQRRAGAGTPAPIAAGHGRVRGHVPEAPDRTRIASGTQSASRSTAGAGSAPGSRATVRIARRSLTLVALLCLIAASAYGAHRMLSSGAHNGPNPAYVPQGAFVPVAHGGTGEDRWSLRLYRRGGEFCRVLTVAETEASRCTPAPGPRTLTVTSVSSPLRRYLFGVAGGEIARVSVRAGASTRTVPTRAPGPSQARAGGLPAHARYFVATLARPVGRPDPPARVQGLDAAGRAAGAAQLDCEQSAEPRRCYPPR